MSEHDFKALDDFLDGGLDLPVKGKDGVTRVYHIADPPAEDGVRIERISSLALRLAAGAAPGTKALDDEEETDLYRLCLGDTYERLLAEVRWATFKHVALTAMFWITADRETALLYWNTQQRPGKVQAPKNREERRQASRGSSASAGASTTPSLASTSGTRAASRRRNSGRRKAA
jgi:hypothetical protein